MVVVVQWVAVWVAVVLRGMLLHQSLSVCRILSSQYAICMLMYQDVEHSLLSVSTHT